MPIDNQFDPLRNVIGRLYDAIHGPMQGGPPGGLDYGQFSHENDTHERDSSFPGHNGFGSHLGNGFGVEDGRGPFGPKGW
ncbi:MAG: hypothetical protein FLDDKLPJ_03668 [Phycisphaerae bacterium]|nr:hypothetical protein [Phycisphaerae bacterium]